MMKLKRVNPFWAVLLIGVVCSLVMLSGRLIAEHRDRQVSVAISYDDVVLLAQEHGVSPESWLSTLQKSGAYYLVVTDENETDGAVLADQLNMRIARSGSQAKVGDAFLMPPVEDYEAVAYDAPAGDSDVPLALIENPWRTGVVMPETFDPDQWDGPMVKSLYMIDGYRYHYEWAEPATENENILFRAVVERGMRLVILTPLIHEGDEELISDPSAYTDMFEGLSARIADRGLVLGEAFSAMDAPKMNPYLLGGALLLLVAAAVYLLRMILKPLKKVEYILLGGGSVLAVGGAVCFPDLMQKIGAFGAALVFPCIAVVFMVNIAMKKELFSAVRNQFARYFVMLAVVALVGIGGGLYISALLSTRLYLLQFSVFSGVKVSQILPMIFSGGLLGYVLFNKNARGQQNKKLPLPLLIVLIVAMAAVLVVLILRSGDNMLPVSALEIRLRNWLEYTLYARPRTKEMLLAFPAIGLFLVASKWRFSLLQLPLGVLASVGPISIINTFCHTFTPLRVSLIRTLLSLSTGAVIGVAGMLIFGLLIGKNKKEE